MTGLSRADNALGIQVWNALSPNPRWFPQGQIALGSQVREAAPLLFHC